MSSHPRAGYTLPVFACAAAIAALRHLQQNPSSPASVAVDLLDPPETAEIAIEQVARLGKNSALAITRSEPGDNLDLTRDTPIWALIERIAAIEPQTHADPKVESPLPPPQSSVLSPSFGTLREQSSVLSPSFGTLREQSSVLLKGGEGIGQQINLQHQPAIYAYARRLIETNLQRELAAGERVEVTIILPEGRALAQRTANAAFGVVEGLSLLGTSGIAQPLSAPGQLEIYRQELQQRRDRYDGLVFCIGENGLDLARQRGIPSDRLIKTANWLGSMLVEAGIQGVQTLLLWGYHGKLIKLAGGIFHTHHHVADGRQEILAAHCANIGLPTAQVQVVFASATTEAALQYLQELDRTTGSRWVKQVYGAIAEQIDRRAEAYIQTHSARSVRVGCVLFDRQRQIIVQSKIGAATFSQICQYS